MICKPCAAEADDALQHAPTRCRVCGRAIIVYGHTKLSYKIMVHKGADGDRCPGSVKPPMITGHAACKGCDCQHKEKRHG